MVYVIGDQQAAAGVHRNVKRAVQPRIRRQSSVPAKAGLAGAGERRDRPVGRDPADAMTLAVGDEKVPCGIRGETINTVEGCVRGGSPVTGGTHGASTRNRLDDAVKADPADARVEADGNIQVANRVQRHRARECDRSPLCRTAVSGETFDAVSCDDRQDSRRRNPHNLMIRGVGDDHAAFRIDDQV